MADRASKIPTTMIAATPEAGIPDPVLLSVVDEASQPSATTITSQFGDSQKATQMQSFSPTQYSDRFVFPEYAPINFSLRHFVHVESSCSQ
ncbi:unnamed protein product [Phytophthora fragariaefolia]|uniref:Unnamed protein product n=1 Tax=Phytophthora fragariaefolia TaxID=1490495 RepID=A0A9W6UE17_9STRA|nr:unnamed protein product [Phytophthora fragariaefolia]